MKTCRLFPLLAALFLLCVPDCAWSLSPSLSKADKDMLLLQEVLTGFKVLAQVQIYGRRESMKTLDNAFQKAGIKQTIIWQKHDYGNSFYSSDTLMVPISFTESEDRYEECWQRYVVICEPKQENYLINADARILKKIPVPKDFKLKEYDSPFQQRNLLIVEERRARLYHGTWRGFLIHAAKSGTKGRTLTGRRDLAVRYTNEIARGIMRGGMVDKGHAYQTVEELRAAVVNKEIPVPETENYGLGYGVVLKFWADRVLPGFSSKYQQGQIIEYNGAGDRAPLNCLTLRSKQDFVILAGLTKRKKWMDESWDGIEFLERPMTSAEIVEAMVKRGTPLYDLYSYEPITSVYNLDRSA